MAQESVPVAALLQRAQPGVAQAQRGQFTGVSLQECFDLGGWRRADATAQILEFEVRVKRVIEQVGACAQQGLTIARTQGRQRVAIQDALALE